MSARPSRAASEPTLSVVLPVFNEGENIARVLRGFATHVRTPHEILVVYDFDEDNTLPAVRDLSDELPQVRLHRNELGRGVLNAMKAGIARARAPYVLIAMADGSDEPQIVDRMVELATAGADVVAGSRYVRGGSQVGGPRLKGLLSRVAGMSLYWAGRMPIHDATSNFKLYSREFLESVTIESQAGFELALELSVKAALGRRPMAEVPTIWRDRTAGQSQFRLAAWLPHYMRWYVHLFRGRLIGAMPRRRPRSPRERRAPRQ